MHLAYSQTLYGIELSGLPFTDRQRRSVADRRYDRVARSAARLTRLTGIHVVE
jgi:hypothetical protein